MAIGGALLVALVAAYVIFLRPDKETRLRYDYVFGAESQVERGNYDEALENYEQALALAPDDPEINLMVGVMYEALQRPAEAASYYEVAEALYETRALFLSMRSQKYILLQWYDKGEADARAAIASDGGLPLAHCALGSAFEGQGRIREAIAAMQKCADLARERGQDQLYVIAATRLATLLQMPVLDTPTPKVQDEGK
jgi:tetratricopeptide (TPR) repeat protein